MFKFLWQYKNYPKNGKEEERTYIHICFSKYKNKKSSFCFSPFFPFLSLNLYCKIKDKNKKSPEL